jgi:hypothetical protein
MGEKRSKGFRAKRAVADVLMAIKTGREGSFRVIGVDGGQPIEADPLPE